VVFTIDLRHSDLGGRRALEERIRSLCKTISQERRLDLAIRTLQEKPPVAMHPEVRALLARAAQECGVQATEMVSGAGHDAQILAARCRVGMLFRAEYRRAVTLPGGNNKTRNIWRSGLGSWQERWNCWRTRRVEGPSSSSRRTFCVTRAPVRRRGADVVDRPDVLGHSRDRAIHVAPLQRRLGTASAQRYLGDRSDRDPRRAPAHRHHDFRDRLSRSRADFAERHLPVTGRTALQSDELITASASGRPAGAFAKSARERLRRSRKS